MVQDTLIYIDDSDRLEAEELAGVFADKNTRNRAYINVLGAELAMKYLASENIKFTGIRNIHSIRKILEEFDISDIMLSNIHIDVRVVFDENIIFIPKSHFEYNLVPDIYLVLSLSQDKSNVKFLGFFEPKLINKNNANNDYYFIEKEKLNSAFDLKKFIENYKGSTSESISDDEMTDCKRIIMDFSDNDISDKDKKHLLSKLTKSLELRDEFLEFENFELLSHAAMTSTYITKKEIVEDINEEIETVEEQPNEEVSNFEENLDILEDLNVGETINAGFDNNTFEAFDNDEFDLSQTDTNEINEDTPQENIETNELEENSLIDESETSDTMSFEDFSETLEENNFEEEATENEDRINLEEISDTTENEIQTESLQDLNTEEDLLTLDDIPELSTSSFSEEIIDTLPSLEDLSEVHTENNFENNLDENINDDLLDIENIESKEEDIKPKDYETETVSLDDIETEVQEERTSDTSEEVVDENLETLEDFDTSAIEDIETVNETSNEIPVENNFEEQEEISNEAITEDKTEEDENTDEILDTLGDINNLLDEEDSDNNNETFGKNLLENLTLENDVTIEAEQEETVENNQEEFLTEISIDEILSDSIPVAETDNIETSDLISQIDDVLNTAENLQQEETTAEVAAEAEETSEDDENIEELETSIADLLEDEQETDDDKLDLLFNDTEVNSEGEISELSDLEELPETSINTQENTQIPGGAIVNKATNQKNTKPLIIAAAILVIAGGLTFTFLKPKGDNNTASSPELPANPVNPPTSNVNENNLSQNTPNLDKISKDESKEIVKEEIKNSPIPKSSESYLSVDKLVWNAPNNLYYNPKFQNYLQTAGKSIKLSLSADLLLATEYAYTNLIKVDLTLNKDGNIESAKIASSSGSEEIDKIVLQSVKDTLNVVKPPSNEIQTPNFNLSLNIYL